MGFLILIAIIGLVSFFIARSVFNKLVLTNKSDAWITSSTIFIISAVLIFIVIMMLGMFAPGIFGRGHPNYTPPQADSTIIDSSRTDTINKIDSIKLK